MRSFEKGEIDCLVWDDGFLTTNWKTREIKGYINDFHIKDADNDGYEDLVLAVVEPEECLTGRAQAIFCFLSFSKESCLCLVSLSPERLLS